MCVVRLMPAVKRANSNALKTGSLDCTGDIVLLLDSSNSIIASGTYVDGCVKKTCARADFCVAVGQVLFINTRHVDSDHVAAALRK